MYAMFIRMAAKPERADELFAAISEVAVKARSEDGCISFDPFRPADDTSTVMIFEKWREKASMEAHMSHDYMKTLMGRLDDLIEGRPELADVIAVEG